MDADLAKMTQEEAAAAREDGRRAMESWVTDPRGLGVLFDRKAYTLYGLAKRQRDQDPYVRTGMLRAHVMAPNRVQAVATAAGFKLNWHADSRILNFMKGKKAVYRMQFEVISKAEAESVERAIQKGLDAAPQRTPKEV